MTRYGDMLEKDHRNLMERVRSSTPDRAQQALTALLAFMDNPDRYRPGSHVTDTEIRRIVQNSYDGAR